MIFAVAQGMRPSVTQWLAIAAVMAGAAIVSRSGTTYENLGTSRRESSKLFLHSPFVRASVLPWRRPADRRGSHIRRGYCRLAVENFRAGHHRRYLSHAAPSIGVARPLASASRLMGGLDVVALGQYSLPATCHPAFAVVVSSAFSAVTVVLARAILKEPSCRYSFSE